MNAKSFLIAGLILFTSIVNAIEVPEAVMKTFKQRFSEVKKAKWEKEKDGNYEAEFDLNGKEMSATFLANGDWRETETEINVSELPKAVSDAFNKLYPDTKIREVSKIQRSDNSVVYETEIKIKGKRSDILFDEKGNKLEK